MYISRAIVYFFFFSLALYGQKLDLPRGFDQLSSEIQTILLAPKQKIFSLQARIQQEIRQGHSVERRTGFYWADNQGRFRAEYSSPEETIVFTGQKLYWYIKSNGFTWVIANQNPTIQTLKKENPLEKKSLSWLNEKFTIEPAPSVWQQIYQGSSYRYLIRPLNLGLQAPFSKLLIEVDLNHKAIVRRTMFDLKGRESLIEAFEAPLKMRDQVFFSKVEVTAKNYQNGLIVKSKTHYQGVVFNQHLGDIFAPLPGPYKNYGLK